MCCEKVRTPSFVSGGWLPASQRGKHLSGLVHIADVYATLCTIANSARRRSSNGGCWSDEAAAPAPDSLDVSEYLLGRMPSSPRTIIIHQLGMWRKNDRINGTSLAAIRVGEWKLLVGKHSQAHWFGDFSPAQNKSEALALMEIAGQFRVLEQARAKLLATPNATFKREVRMMRAGVVRANNHWRRTVLSANHLAGATTLCNETAPCLFHVAADPEERHDLAKERPDKLRELLGVLMAVTDVHERNLRRGLLPIGPANENKTVQLGLGSNPAWSSRSYLQPATSSSSSPRAALIC